MKIKQIEELAQSFKSWLQDCEDFPEIYKYENLINYRSNWDINASDFHSMFDLSFKSNISNKLWGGSINSAKSVMLQFIEHNPEYVRSMFKDLYNENKDFSLRVNRFAFHCDHLLQELPKARHKPVEHRHNPAVLSVYLAFHDPDTYGIVDYPSFKRMMEILENQSIPQDFELERIMKLYRGLYKVLQGDEELLSLHEKCIPEEYRCEPGLLLVHDFIICRKHYKTY